MTQNRAAFVLEDRRMEMGPVSDPQLGPADVLIKMEYCGVCGSDVHFYEHGQPGYPDVYPFVLGHEGAGEIIDVGAEVTHLAKGDRVAIEPGIPCRVCEWCVGGRYNLCPNIIFLSAYRAHGVLRNYITHPALLCYKLPENVTSLEGALIEPLAVGMSAAVNAGIRIGQSAAILGSGCIGLVTLLALRAIGITDITMVDLFDIRLDKAKQMGAANVVNASDVNPVAAVRDLHRGDGPDFVFETAGHQVTAGQTVPMVKRGGTISIIGNVVGQTPMDLQLMTSKELQLKTAFRYRNIYPTALEAVAAGRIDLSGIVSRIYPFDSAQQAFDDSITQKESMVKAVIHVSG